MNRPPRWTLTIQAQIIELLKELQEKFKMALIFIFS